MVVEKVENCTSEALECILAELTTDQIRFVIARQEYASDKDAARAIGISARTVYGWPEAVKEAVRLMALDGVVTARHILARSLAKAALIKAAGLDSDDERIRQATSTEILDRELGRPTQRSEISGPDGGALIVNFVSNVDDGKL